jgi:hypothetical protein
MTGEYKMLLFCSSALLLPKILLQLTPSPFQLFATVRFSSYQVVGRDSQSVFIATSSPGGLDVVWCGVV